MIRIKINYRKYKARTRYIKKDSSNNADKIKQLESQYKKLNAEFDRTIWNQLSSLEASIKKSNVSPDSKDVDDKEKAEKRKKDDGYSVQLEHYLFDEYYLPPEKEERKEEKLEEQKEQK